MTHDLANATEICTKTVAGNATWWWDDKDFPFKSCNDLTSMIENE